MHQLYELQDFIFESNPKRQDLLDYKPNQIHKKKFTIYVYRNHSFELIEKTILPFLDYAGITVEFKYSDYDDSLSFFDLDTQVDLIILWLDLSRYQNNNTKNFIDQRIDALKNIYQKNILLVPFGSEYTTEDPQITLYPVGKWQEILGNNYQDLRLERFSGTKMSMALTLNVSRELGLRYLPALLTPSLKCIVLDLDNTLYKGVLGEDGIEGIEVTQGHNLLQQRIAELASEGFFICVVSKNDQRDVDQLLAEHRGFSVTSKNITIAKASWEPKALAIAGIASELNIGIDSMLFIDDNIGEINSVKQAHPDIKTIFAKDDANITLDILNNYPGLLKLGATVEDSLRSSDSKANAERLKILSTSSKEDFIRQMEIQVEFLINPVDKIYRISELANKTNQFIFNYKRYSIAEVESLINSSDAVVVAIAVKDKLSDSGIVGVIVMQHNTDKDYIDLEECFVSCRALGRGIDQILISGAITLGLQKLASGVLKTSITEGERNLPALNYYKEHLATYSNPKQFSYQIPDDLVKVIITEL